MNKSSNTTKDIILTGMFMAVLAVLSQIQIPMPSGVPVTMQAFAIALTGFVLGWKKGLMTTAVYILAGAVGLPVFTGFSGGFGRIAGPTGGFLWGFLFLAAACGIAGKKKGRVWKGTVTMAGLLFCHFLGTIQFMFVSGCTFFEAMLLVSVPYLIKDTVSVMAACVLAGSVAKRLNAAGISLL